MIKRPTKCLGQQANMARALGLRNRDSGRRGWGFLKKEINRGWKKKRKKKKKKTSKLIRDMVKIGKPFCSETTRQSCEAALPSPVVFKSHRRNTGQHDYECVSATMGDDGHVVLFLPYISYGPQAETSRNTSSSLSVTRGLGAVAKFDVVFPPKIGRSLSLTYYHARCICSSGLTYNNLSIF